MMRSGHPDTLGDCRPHAYPLRHRQRLPSQQTVHSPWTVDEEAIPMAAEERAQESSHASRLLALGLQIMANTFIP